MNEISQILRKIPGTQKAIDVNRPPVVISFNEECDPDHPLAALSMAQRIQSREHAFPSEG